MTVRIICADVFEGLRQLPDESVHMVCTSPPYWGLRDYGVPPSIWGGDPGCKHRWGKPQRTAHANSVPGPTNPGKNGKAYRCETKWTGPLCERCGAWRGAHGLEPTFELYVANEVAISREIWRVLRADGTLWLNLGDCYATGAGRVGLAPGGGEQGARWAGRPALGTTSQLRDRKVAALDGHRGTHTVENSGKAGPRIAAMGPMTQPNRMPQPGLKSKDLVGIPWRVAFALQAEGWYLRQDIIWAKPNPMPESVRDRCTKSHEYLFLLSKSERYHFDADAIAEPSLDASIARSERGRSEDHKWADGGPGDHTIAKVSPSPGRSGNKARKSAFARGVPDAPPEGTNGAGDGSVPWEGFTRNKRSVWTVSTAPFADAHFATFPPALIEPAILAGCPEGGTVLDPFSGAGTACLVADRLQRNAIGIELNPKYAEMARRRIEGDAPLFTEVTAA